MGRAWSIPYELLFFRTDIRKYIRTKCPSFVARNSNAQFCEIFLKTAFCDFVNDFYACAAISRVIVSLFTSKTFCTYRDRDFKVENQASVSYISVGDLITQSITPELWFD